MAELVVADQAVRYYPGGVVVLRAQDFMGPARGTLSSESDPLACTGTAVRDTQQVASSIYSANTTAYGDADDTLVIPLGDIRWRFSSYYLIVSMRIEGDWDPTNTNTTRDAITWQFVGACELGMHSSAGIPTTSAPWKVLHRPRKRPHYTNQRMRGMTTTSLTPVTFFPKSPAPPRDLFVRAYSQAGTDIEILIDQLIFLPTVAHQKIGTGYNLKPHGPSAGGAVTLDHLVDGDDGGDDNGEFTWDGAPGRANMGLEIETELGLNRTVDGFGQSYTVEGSGDYQRKAPSSTDDIEYQLIIDPDDDGHNIFTASGSTTDKAYLYTSHCAQVLEDEEVMLDDPLDRTVAGSWGTSPDGYLWSGGTAGADGVGGILHVSTAANSQPSAFVGVGTAGGFSLPTGFPGAKMFARNYEYYGEVRIRRANDPGDTQFWDAGTDYADTIIYVAEHIIIRLTPLVPKWDLIYIREGTIGGASASDILYEEFVAIPLMTWFSWRFERTRYKWKVKVWETDAGEPADWSAEGFLPSREGSAPGTTLVEYPYTDEPTRAHDRNTHGRLDFHSNWQVMLSSIDVILQWRAHFRNFMVINKAYGDPESMYASVESPLDTFVDEIEIPYGAGYFVYWGGRVWTTEVSPGSHRVDLGLKVWNDLDADELQLAGSQVVFFTAMPDGTIVSMNWRNTGRHGSTRILIGTASGAWRNAAVGAASIRDAIADDFTTITAEVPTIFNFTDGDDAGDTQISDGGSDMYDGGNELSTDLDGPIPYTGGEVVSASSFFGENSAYFTDKHTGIFVLSAINMNIDSIAVNGNNGADGSGFADSAILPITVGGEDYTVFVKRVWGTSDPSINQIFIVPGDGAGITQDFSADTNNGFHELTGLTGLDRIYYVLVARTSGAKLDDADVEDVAEAFVALLP